ncbi:MAG TPA: hypothetical protein VMW93_08905 [bacterium]|nr:hypothetical protein [bacterium]
MKRRLVKIIAAALLAGVAAASASRLGSIVNSFPARVNHLMPTGMAYADGYIWMMYVEGYMAKRAHPSGSVVRTFDFYPHIGSYRGLAYDGSYFWTSYSYRDPVPRLLKISPPTMSVVGSYPLSKFNGPLLGLEWDGKYFWMSILDTYYYVFRVASTGSIVSSFRNPYRYAPGICYVDDLPGGPRLFELNGDVFPPMFYVYKAPAHTFDYRFYPRHTGARNPGCWDGEYLWTYANHDPGGNEYCYQLVAWEPDYAVTPASVGKVKALFR